MNVKKPAGIRTKILTPTGIILSTILFIRMSATLFISSENVSKPLQSLLH